MRKRKLLIVDTTSEEDLPIDPAVKTEMGKIAKLTGEQLLSYGRDLSTVARSRAWLMDKRNWFKGHMWIIRWDGLVPRICEAHGEKLYTEPRDNGLPSHVVVRQAAIRASGKDIEEDIVVE